MVWLEECMWQREQCRNQEDRDQAKKTVYPNIADRDQAKKTDYSNTDITENAEDAEIRQTFQITRVYSDQADIGKNREGCIDQTYIESEVRGRL